MGGKLDVNYESLSGAGAVVSWGMRLLSVTDLKRVTSDPEQAAMTRFQNDLQATPHGP